MRRLLLAVVMLCCAHCVSAQRPWGDYDQKQQQRILSSKRTPQQVCDAVGRLDDVRGVERDMLLDVVTTPTKDKQLASLYLYIYELLRSDDGSMACYDVAMLRAYPKYMLERWTSDDHHYDLYNYAYAVALHGVRSGESRHADGVMRALTKGSSRRTKGLARRFETCVDVAARSLTIGENTFLDRTTPNTLDLFAESIAKERFDAAVGCYAEVARPTFESADEDHIIMMKETIMWYGGYYVELRHSLGRNINLVYVMTPLSASMALCDAQGEWSTLPWMLYVTKEGMLYGVVADEGFTVESIVVGTLRDGGLNIAGVVAIEDGELGGVKCCDDGLYLAVDGASGLAYYLIPTLL